jgi:hypothetical protein
MPGVGFESTITVFERAKTVHGLDCSATVISSYVNIEAEIRTGLTMKS